MMPRTEANPYWVAVQWQGPVEASTVVYAEEPYPTKLDGGTESSQTQQAIPLSADDGE
jgi:hypothetical protein